MINIELPSVKQLQDERLVEKELMLAQQRAITGATRKLATISRRRVREDIRPRGVRERVRVEAKDGRIWYGANPIQALQFRNAKTLQPLKADAGKGRRVIVNGEQLPGVFVRESVGKVALRNVGRRKLEAVELEANGILEEARDNASKQAEAILLTEFNRAVTSIIRNRKI